MIHKNFRCEFYFIRHGESESNATPGLAAGANYDSALTDRGVKQARLLGSRLKREGVKFDRVYSSSLDRARKTARYMLDTMGETERDVPAVDALVEQKAMGWRGVPVEEVFTPENVAYIMSKGADFIPPQGESLRMVRRRVSGWVESEIIYNEELVSSHRELTVAVVGHGTASRCLFQYIMGFNDALLGRVALDNTSISRFVFDRNGWSVVRLNDASHLMEEAVSFDARP